MSNNITDTHSSFPIYIRVIWKKLFLGHLINSLYTFAYCEKQHAGTFKTFHTSRSTDIILRIINRF